jgi:hypothetical protein
MDSMHYFEKYIYINGVPVANSFHTTGGSLNLGKHFEISLQNN